MILFILVSKNITLFGFYGKEDVNVIYLYSCKSWSIGIQVSINILVPSDLRKAMKSSSSLDFSNFMGSNAHELTCASMP